MTTRFVAATDIDAAPLEDGGLVLFHAPSGKFVMLNRSSTMIWTEMSGPRTEEQLATMLCQNFPDVDLPAAQLDVQETLQQLRNLDLVQVEGVGTSATMTQA